MPDTNRKTPAGDKLYEPEQLLDKKINHERDVIHFKTKSPAFNIIKDYIDLLAERIFGTGNKFYNSKYETKHKLFIECSEFLLKLEKCCDETDLTLAKGSSGLRFGHIAYRDWFDKMKILCREFIDTLSSCYCSDFRDELYTYLTESFGNRMRIDYGTGHELNFILFTMGLANLTTEYLNDKDLVITKDKLKPFVESHGIDIIALFCRHYLNLCRKLQTKFRLEPAGSRGIYNMDDFQFLPFLLGSAQLVGIKYIRTNDFYAIDQVDQFKSDFIFFDAIDFIMKNKRGPFNEHSYTLWNFTSLGSWDSIHRRIKVKFIEDILNPFPVIQHFLFGKHILRWELDPSLS